MSPAHAHGAGDGLVVHAHGPVHELPAHGKLLALVAFVLVVVATPVPRRLGDPGWTPYGLYLLLVLATLALARVPWRIVLRRSVIEVPFLAFAALLPFVATGPRVQLGPLQLAEAGLAGGLGLVAKATVGVLAAILLATTTPPRELLAGLERLHLPGPLVAILSFMVRYLAVVADDAHRMRVARESRGFTGGGARHLAAVAGSAGTLFVRSYERGERVHLAMQARGYEGTMPRLDSLGVGDLETRDRRRASNRRGLAACALLPAAAVLVHLTARIGA